MIPVFYLMRVPPDTGATAELILPAQKSIFDFNPDNPLGGSSSLRERCGQFAAIFAACSASIDRL
jgi:hypothetical protein